MADYIWELGIDWNATEDEGSPVSSYLRQGFVKLDPLAQPALSRPTLKTDDTVTFRIFDVTSSSNATPSAQVTGILSFVILSEAAVNNQPGGEPLSNLEPPVTLDLTTPPSTIFETVHRSWSSLPVPVPETLETKRFLLTFQAQAQGPAGSNSRLFVHDPEMVVGPFG